MYSASLRLLPPFSGLPELLKRVLAGGFEELVPGLLSREVCNDERLVSERSNKIKYLFISDNVPRNHSYGGINCPSRQKRKDGGGVPVRKV